MSKYATQSDFRNPMQKRAAGSLFCVLVLFYLGFHTVSGERGVFALLRERHKLEVVQAELADVKAKHAVLEKKIQKMSNDSLDLDLLDEQARLVLGTSNKDEVVLLMDKKAAE